MSPLLFARSGHKFVNGNAGTAHADTAERTGCIGEQAHIQPSRRTMAVVARAVDCGQRKKFLKISFAMNWIFPRVVVTPSGGMLCGKER